MKVNRYKYLLIVAMNLGLLNTANCVHQRERELRKSWRDAAQSAQQKGSKKDQQEATVSPQASADRWTPVKDFIHRMDQQLSLGRGVIDFAKLAQDWCENSPQIIPQEQAFACKSKLPAILNLDLALELSSRGIAALLIKDMSANTSKKLFNEVLKETNSVCQEQQFLNNRATGAREFRVCRLPSSVTLAIGRFLSELDTWHVSIAVIGPD